MTFTLIKNDLIGGATAGLVALPRNMAFGILIFLPFGPEYASLGILAGLMSMMVSNVISAPIGSIPVMCMSTFSLSALIMMSMNQLVVSRLTGLGLLENPIPVAINYCFLATLLAGVTQGFCGIVRIGNIAKFIPHPVLSGLLNGTAVAIILSQIRVILDVDSDLGVLRALRAFDSHSMLLISVSALTILAALLGPRTLKAVPGVFFGLLFGSLAFYLLQHFSGIDPLGPVVGAIPPEIPTPKDALGMLLLIVNPNLQGITFTVMLFGISIGLADVMRAALSGLVIDLKTQSRSDFNKELVGEGLGNMAAAFFGGITSTGNATAALNNHSHGGTSYLSRAICGLAVLAVILFFRAPMGMLPLAVLATMLIILTIVTMDFNFVDNVRQLRDPELTKRAEIVIDLSVIAFVAALVIFADLFVALGIGISLSFMLFVFRNSRSLVRQQFGAHNIPSNIMRLQLEKDLLDRIGYRIQVLDLEGPLFFGSADQLHDRIDPFLNGRVEIIILDLERVTGIDSTASTILLQCIQRAERAGKSLFLGTIDEHTAKAKFPEMLKTLKNYGDHCFSSLDDAIAAGEEILLDKKLGHDRVDEEIAIDQVDALQALDQDEIDVLKEYLVRCEYGHGDYIMTESAREEILYFIVKGRADIIRGNPATGVSNRIGAFCAGSTIGEMALFDTKPRSASAIADGRVICYSLALKDFNTIRRSDPSVAYDIVFGVGQVFAKRIRTANKIVAQLRL